MTESNIIFRIARGDFMALDEVYNQTKPGFVAFFAAHFNLDTEKSIDLYQDSIAAFYNNIKTGRLTAESLKDARISTYIIQVGKYIHMSRLRKREPLLTFDTDTVMNLKDKLPDEFDQELDDKLFIVRKTVETMPQPCGKLMDLKFFQEKSPEDIATIMGYENTDSVKTQVYKCKEKLREKIVERFKACGYGIPRRTNRVRHQGERR